MKIDWKWLAVPFSNKTREVQAVALWEVRWIAATDYAAYSGYAPMAEFFPDKEEAEAFAESLRAAFKLLRIRESSLVSGRTRVTCKQVK